MAKTKDKKLQEITAVLKKELRPTRLFLFGSRSNGTHKADSDYDFVVVTKRPKKDHIGQMSDARDILREKCGVSADVFIYSQKEFDEWKDELSSIPETALNTGIEIDLG